jgi:hypothetical protein
MKAPLRALALVCSLKPSPMPSSSDHIASQLFQALDDVGFTIPAQGLTSWNGEAMQGTDYLDLEQTPETTAGTNRTVARNAAHLARLLKSANYPGDPQH